MAYPGPTPPSARRALEVSAEIFVLSLEEGRYIGWSLAEMLRELTVIPQNV
jgi:hypothetical protein